MMIWILKTLPGSGTKSAAAFAHNFWGLRDLPSIAQRFTSLATGRPALQVALIAAAAVAGYLVLTPFQHRSSAIAAAEQPQWVGHIERPDLDAQPQAAPVTSASYLAPETALSGSPAKKAVTTAAVAPKNASAKPVLPPRRPEDANRPTAAAAPVVVASAEVVPPGLIPPEAIPAPGTEASRPRNLLSRVADRLPAKGSLLKPFSVVGDAFHNLVKSF